MSYGLCGQVLGWALISRGLPRTSGSLGGLLLLLQPTFAFIWDVLFFVRSTSRMEVADTGLTQIAIYMGGRRRQCPARGYGITWAAEAKMMMPSGAV
ncbi:hypothetical protein DFAR_1110035 [Desulfarculales bacterium]